MVFGHQPLSKFLFLATAQALARYGSYPPSRRDAGTGVAGGARE